MTDAPPDPNPIASPPAGWQADPWNPAGFRWWDGTQWTGHATAAGPAARPWKGADLGRPAMGSGSLADPARRLGARLLDSLVLLPAQMLIMFGAFWVAFSHLSFDDMDNGGSSTASSSPQVGSFLIWMWGGMFVAGILTLVVLVGYESVCTARWGRTFGKRWLGIRPLRTDGTPLTGGRAAARAAAYALSSMASFLGVINVLWCLWDEHRQCIHDKVVDTIVVND